MDREPRRIRGHIPWDATELRLRVGRSLIVATTRPDGRPHAILMVEGPARPAEGEAELDRVDAAYRGKYVDPVSGATASIYDNPADRLYRLDPWRVVTWMYGTVGGWTEWRFDER